MMIELQISDLDKTWKKNETFDSFAHLSGIRIVRA